MQKLQPALREYLTKLREDAFIDIKPGYVDTAASANETKPVETASKDPNAKPLKKKKKFGIF
jgi:peptidyl-prolyl cis-trans isomerase SurA